MTTRKVKAVEYTCDGCGREFLLAEPIEESPHGFHGNVWEIHSGGGSGTVEWFAHQEACISAAIVNALKANQ